MRLVLGLAVLALAVGATTTKSSIPSATCDNAIEIPDEQPPPPDALVLGRVEMPRSDEVLELGGSADRGGPHFAKRGFSVTAGSPVLLEVPRRYRSVYGLAAGRGRLGSPALRLRPCSANEKPWTSWAGGYLAFEPVCVWIFVRADGRSERVPLNIGRTCERVSDHGGNHGNGLDRAQTGGGLRLPRRPEPPRRVADADRERRAADGEADAGRHPRGRHAPRPRRPPEDHVRDHRARSAAESLVPRARRAHSPARHGHRRAARRRRPLAGHA